MKKLAVIHYMPLEYYPPVTNFLDIAATYSFSKIKVWSTDNVKNRVPFNNPEINISRAPFPKTNDRAPLRLLKYCIFNLKTLIGLLLFKPDSILYYDSFSAWPVAMYYKLKRVANTDLFIHYHEYFSLTWYKKSMYLVNKYHHLENSILYPITKWISQTNKDRIHLFLQDHPDIEPNKLHTLANYPPKKWLELSKKNAKVPSEGILKTVYIGSLSLRDTYIKEYCEWVIQQNGKVNFDIYAYNLHKDTTAYLHTLNSVYINFYDKGIEYHEIPIVLSNYNVGLILYKAKTDNYKYNAPNKLFEYLSCNLIVWYSDKMLGIKPYNAKNVIPINFEESFLPTIPNTSAITDNIFTAQNELSSLLKKIKE